MHSLLYCFANRYNFERLVSLTIRNIQDMEQVPYVNILDTAKRMYHKLPENDLWYRDYFKNETRKAMRENVDLGQESWILNVFREKSGFLTVDLFSTLMDGARSETTAQDLVPAMALTPTTPVFDQTPCENRRKHLTSLKGDGPWKNCAKCRYEREQMMTTGRAIVSVVFTDIWPTFSQDVSNNPDIDQPKSRKKGRKKLRKAFKEAVCQIPIDRVNRGILAEDGYTKCPDQAEHLQKQDGKWLWESCSRCIYDRQLMLDKLRELGVGEGLSVNFGFRSASEPDAAHMATALPEVHNQHMDLKIPAVVEGSLAAETPNVDMIIVEESLQFKDDTKTEPVAEPVNCKANGEDSTADILQESPQTLNLDDEPAESSCKRKGKKKRKRWIESEKLAAVYDPVLEDLVEVADGVITERLQDAPGNHLPTSDPDTNPGVKDDSSPPDAYPESAPEETPLTEQEPESVSEETPLTEQEPEFVDPWSFWGVEPNKSKKRDKAQETLSFASPREASDPCSPSDSCSPSDPCPPSDPCSPSDLWKHWYAERPRFMDNTFESQPAEHTMESSPVGEAEDTIETQSPPLTSELRQNLG
jgi:hypothetical protein